ncbi:penicillin-binding transpeptidase domain-containing protein [Bacillus salipaludis]|uniref:penicillin-binding transpeptidase domain-containing protein n=1 Tax=Bacillus salipaludis TaxID=2547811 RepID=UPI002E23851A|nr:penicillin-binding transpeptidase domain-containing protein [Bacillus salipaludis]
MFFKKALAFLMMIGLLFTGSFYLPLKTSAHEKNIQGKKGKYYYEDLSRYFTGYDGTFLLYDIKKKKYTIYNKKKSNKQVSPNSTFKIPHALFGLDKKVLQDEITLFKWDGTIYPFEAWNQDQTLTSAVQNSVIWYFQDVAQQLGPKNEQVYLNSISYGNKDISGGLTNFWLQSSLKISPLEQLNFLKRFYTYQLPFSKRTIDLVKKILVIDHKNGALLSGKTGTGWANGEINGTPINGWFIGYVEKKGETYIFTTNIEADHNASSSKAKDITLRILKDKGIYD